MMKVWTCHPDSLNLVDTTLVLDASKGRYYRDRRNGLRYAQVRLRLLESLPTDQFLWCVTREEEATCPYDQYGLMKWELEIDPAKVWFINSHVWDNIVYGRSEEWNRLFVGIPKGPDTKVHALVPFPHHQITCNGLAPPTPRIEIKYS